MRPLFHLFVLCWLATTAGANELPAPMREALHAAGVPLEAVGVVARPLEAAAPVVAHQSELSLQPGSTMKVLTSAAALALLGASHRGGTELWTRGPTQAGVLRGDVILRGQADPGLDTGALLELLHRLRGAGVRRIAGDVIIDRTHFHPERLDTGVPPFDEAPEFAYNAIPDALNLNGGLLGFVLRAERGRVRVSTEPALAEVRARSAQTLSAAACKDWDEGWQTATVRARETRVEIGFNGSFPADCEVRESLQLFDRDRLVAAMVRQLWGDLGGRLDGRVRVGALPQGAQRVAQHSGRPLAEVLRTVLKASDNLLTRLVFLEIGARAPASWRDAHPATLRASAERIKDWLRGEGIAPAGLVLDNGSGLSRSERITPDQMAALLARAWRAPWAPELIQGLPLAGVDGTMRKRLKGTRAEGRARIKTGTLRNVDAVAGYVYDADERPWIVVGMINVEPGQRGRPALDALIEWVASQRRAPPAQP